MSDEIRQELLDKIASAVNDGPGWFTIAVAADPPFAYTAGRTSKGRPELLVSGSVTPEVAHGIIGSAIERLDQAGIGAADIPEEGRTVDQILDGGYLVRLKPIPVVNALEHLTFAYAYQDEIGARPELVEALQIILPDRQGLFPGDPENSAPRQLQFDQP